MVRRPASSIAGALALACVFGGITAGPARAEALVIKLATLAPQGSEWHRILQEMAAEWQKVSGGAVTVRLYPGGVAGDDIDVVRKLRLGTLNAALLTSGGLMEAEPQILALQLPLAFPDYATLDCVMAKMAPRLEQAYAAKGLVIAGWTDGGYIQFFSKSPVRTPDDLRREKLFVWAGDDVYNELWKSAKFNIVPLPSTEMSTALQTGLVSALPATPQAAILLQWYTHAKNMTELNWSVLFGAVVVTQATWDKIPAAVRPALLESARKAGARIREGTRGSYAKDIEAMKKRGLNVVTLDAATRAQWLKAVEESYPLLRKYIPAELIETALRYRDECRGAPPKAAAAGPKP